METDHLDDRTYALLFGVRRSVRYHHNRERFYRRWNTLTLVFVLLSSSAAVTAFFAALPQQYAWVPAGLAAFAALASAIDIAFATGQKALQHADLARRFIWLEKKFAKNRNLSDSEFEKLTIERLDIEAAEPPNLRLLDALCHFELLRALGDETVHPAIPLWRRIAAHIFSQGSYARSLGEKTAGG